MNNELLSYWVKVLRLTDWTIKLIDNCSPDDLSTPRARGECEWEEVCRVAVIRIIDEKYYGEQIVPFDYEKTLVHELMHIKFHLLDENENELQNRVVHQLVEDMAVALVQAKRTTQLN